MNSLSWFTLQEGHDHYIHMPEIRTDPQQRCAATLVFDRKLVILPFRQHSSLMEIENGSDEVPLCRLGVAECCKPDHLGLIRIDLCDRPSFLICERWASSTSKTSSSCTDIMSLLSLCSMNLRGYHELPLRHNYTTKLIFFTPRPGLVVPPLISTHASSPLSLSICGSTAYVGIIQAPVWVG